MMMMIMSWLMKIRVSTNDYHNDYPNDYPNDYHNDYPNDYQNDYQCGYAFQYKTVCKMHKYSSCDNKSLVAIWSQTSLHVKFAIKNTL